MRPEEAKLAPRRNVVDPRDVERERVVRICSLLFDRFKVYDTLSCNKLFWRLVFVRVFRRSPTGDRDPNWDVLLHRSGFGTLQIVGGLLQQRLTTDERWNKKPTGNESPFGLR